MSYYPLLCSLLLCWTALPAQSPGWQAELDHTAGLITTVEANGRSFEQSLSLVGEEAEELQFRTTITEKNGKSNEERFEFHLIDLNARLLRREVRGKVMYLTIKTDNNLRMIKYYRNDEQENYRNTFTIAVNDAEAFRVLSDAFEALIKAGQQQSKLDFSAMDFGQQLAFLQQNIGTVESDGDTYNQELVLGSPQYFLQFKTNEFTDKKNTAREAHLNLADLSSKSVKINVVGKKLLVKLGADKNNRWIKNYEEGAFANYSNDLEVLVKTTAEARNIIAVLKELIPAATQLERERLAGMLTEGTGLAELIGSYVTKVSTGRAEYDQSLRGSCVLELTRETLAEKGASGQEIFTFNLIDFGKKSATVSSSANSLSVTLKAKERRIQHLRDGELQNYRNTVSLYVDEVDQAKVLAYLLNEQIDSCNAMAADHAYEGRSKEELFEQATALVLDVELSSASYQQTLATEEGETCKLQLTQIRSTKNKDIETLYDFSLSDINPKSIDFVISGKNLSVQLATRKREKVIKEYQGDDDSDYTDRIRIYTNDIEETRTLVGLLEELTRQCIEEGN
ncbi:MAG: hypothetical protein AAFW73_19090 [Bacteroidota bacterium]